MNNHDIRIHDDIDPEESVLFSPNEDGSVTLFYNGGGVASGDLRINRSLVSLLAGWFMGMHLKNTEVCDAE